MLQKRYFLTTMQATHIHECHHPKKKESARSAQSSIYRPLPAQLPAKRCDAASQEELPTPPSRAAQTPFLASPFKGLPQAGDPKNLLHSIISSSPFAKSHPTIFGSCEQQMMRRASNWSLKTRAFSGGRGAGAGTGRKAGGWFWCGWWF